MNKEALRLLTKFFPVILLVSFLASVVAFMITSQGDVSYNSHFSYVVRLDERETSDDFRFDGFYALQATESFANTLAAWTQQPEIIVQAFQRAGLELPNADERALVRMVRANKGAGQLVHVVVTGRNRGDVERLTAGLQEVIRSNIALYHADGEPAAIFDVIVTDSWVGVTRVSVMVITVATFLFVFLVGLNVVILYAYRR